MNDDPYAEKIAAAVADLRAGRVFAPAGFDRSGKDLSAVALARAAAAMPVVDVTAVHRAYDARDKGNPYEDHPVVVSPWDDALLAYVGEEGHVTLLHLHRHHRLGHDNRWGNPDGADPAVWGSVEQVNEVTVWLGSRHVADRITPVFGPVTMMRVLVGHAGEPVEIRRADILARTGGAGLNIGQDVWNTAAGTALAALNFLNARNVDIADPPRPRGQRRRLGRTGVTVSTIVVRPPGKHRPSAAGVPVGARQLGDLETVLNPVRGHFAHYGPQYGRGLLFGKHAGRYWIPPVVRGATTPNQPVPVRDYRLQPAPTTTTEEKTHA